MDKSLPITYASSSSVYGLNTKIPFQETDRIVLQACCTYYCTYYDYTY